MEKYILQDWGADVQYVIDKVQDLVEKGGEEATLFSPADRAKLEKLNIFYNTTEYWDEHDFIPPAGAFVIYSDYKKVDIGGESTIIAGFKIGSGNAYLSDLSFSDDSARLDEHISNHIMHVTQEERERWNNKLNVDDEHEVIGETLVLNRQ